jgi:PPOX class probable FMN-dependent enzyme
LSQLHTRADARGIGVGESQSHKIESQSMLFDSGGAQVITSLAQLAAIYGEPSDLVKKLLRPKLDKFDVAFIDRAPFLVLATADGEGMADASPKGDGPGFVAVIDERTIHLPDRLGNNRTQALKNIVANPKVGLLFFVPGMNEVLRVHGTARIRIDPELLARYAVGGKQPRTVVEITVVDVRFHCGKAIIRSKLWKAEAQNGSQGLATFGEIIAEQAGGKTANEMDCMLDEAYAKRLY